MHRSLTRHLPRLALPLLTVLCAVTASASTPEGRIDPNTRVSAPLGTFAGVAYTRHEAMFDGVTSNGRPFRVPCQIIAPTTSGQGSGLMLFDWLVPSTIPTAVGQEQADGRYTLTDAFLFGRGVAYATVRCDIAAIGTESPVADTARPWSDDLLDTSSEFITSAGDEFDIVVAYLRALRTDASAVTALGPIHRRAAFGYSASAHRLRGLLRMPAGIGQFDFSLVGGSGNGFAHPTGNGIGFTKAERDPLPGAGREIDFQSETDMFILGAHKTRHESANYRVYQFAGAAHLRDVEAHLFGLADPASANTADWVPFFRALFVAADNWCDGIQPPPSLWLGAPNSALIARDQNGNALVTHVATQAQVTSGYRLPCVGVGENLYLPIAPSFIDGTYFGDLRAIAGSHVDLTGHFPSHVDYVAQVTQRANDLQTLRYLLPADAAAIIQTAIQSSIGN